jgi:hypothetical protein
LNGNCRSGNVKACKFGLHQTYSPANDLANAPVVGNNTNTNNASSQITRNDQLDYESRKLIWQLLPIWTDLREMPRTGLNFSDPNTTFFLIRTHESEKVLRQIKSLAENPTLVLFLRRVHSLVFEFGQEKHRVEKTMDGETTTFRYTRNNTVQEITFLGMQMLFLVICISDVLFSIYLFIYLIYLLFIYLIFRILLFYFIFIYIFIVHYPFLHPNFCWLTLRSS